MLVSLPDAGKVPLALLPIGAPFVVVSMAPELPCEPESATELPVFAVLLVQAEIVNPAINIVIKLNFFMLRFLLRSICLSVLFKQI